MIQWEDQISRWFDDHREEMIAVLKRFVSIPSVTAYGAEGTTYGPDCCRMMDAFIDQASEMGYQTERFEEHVVSAFPKHQPDGKTIGIWAHLDVVPPGPGWSSDPFQPVLKDGFLIGRGSDDNKSAAAGSLFVMKCLRELGIPMKNRVQLYAGCDEECGSHGVTWFAANCRCPDLSIIPDSGFPVCYGEKGIMTARIESGTQLSKDVLSLSGGEVSNMIPGTAEMVLQKTPAVLSGLSGLCAEITAEEKEDRVILTAHGKGGHAAGPAYAVNANQVLLDGITAAGILCKEDVQTLRFLREAVGDIEGKVLGINGTDDISGATTCAGTILSLRDGKPSLALNIRYCITADGDELIRRMQSACESAGCVLCDTTDSKPNYFPKENPLVDTLTRLYQEVTGLNGQAYVMGGGTYARKLPNAFAFGIGGLPWERPEWLREASGGAHQRDEVLNIDAWLKALTLFTLGLIEAGRYLEATK